MPQEQTDNIADTNASPQHQPSQRSVAIAKWVHGHKSATSNNAVGYLGYQYARSAVASVPYGLSMAGTWLGFQKLEEAVGKLPSAERLGSAANYGKRFFGSPLLRTGTMIGTSFSLYRATSKICKWVNEYLFNPEDSYETTLEKVEHLPQMIEAKAKEVYMPEFHSTLVSAFVLAALTSIAAGVGNTPHTMKALEETRELLGNKNYSFNPEGWQHFWKEAIVNPRANFVPFAAINSLAYSMFFELGDRRFKDKQVSRGMWAGDTHSIGSSSKSHPSLLQEPLPGHEEEYAAAMTREGKEDETLGQLPQGSRMNDKLSILTSEPSFMRFIGRRLLPTTAGIAIYSAIKMRGGYQFLGKFPDYDRMKTAGGFLENAWREGANTSLFFVVPAITDKYAPQFDRFVNNLEAKVSGRTYEEVIAGHQPLATQAQMAQADMPDSKVQKPATHEQRVVAGEHAHAVAH